MPEAGEAGSLAWHLQNTQGNPINGVEASVGSQGISFCMHQAGSSLQHPDLCSISLPLVRDSPSFHFPCSWFMGQMISVWLVSRSLALARVTSSKMGT